MIVNNIVYLIATSLLAILSIGALVAIAIRIKADQEIGRIWRSLELSTEKHRFTEDLVAELPAPVQRYFLHAIAPRTPLASSVSLKMSGSFRMAQDKPWLPMQANRKYCALQLRALSEVEGRGWLRLARANAFGIFEF